MTTEAAPGRWHRLETAALLAPALLLVLVIFVVPLARFLSLAFTAPEGAFSAFAELGQSPVYRRIMLNTFATAGAVTLITAILGWPLAYLLSRARGVWFTVLIYGVLFPLWISILVRTYSWMLLLERNGPINRAVQAMGLSDGPLPLLFNHTGVLIGMVHVLLPYMVLPLYGAMSRIDPRLMLASDGLGAGLWQSFHRIWLPLTLPGLAGGATFVFLLSLGFYITPSLLGGQNGMMLPSLIVSFINDHLNWHMAAAGSLALLAVVAVLMLIAARFLRLDKGMFAR
jgi:putative spermidine/putrescine transport system permease protein